MNIIAFLSLSAIESTPTRLDLVIAKTSSRRAYNTLKEVLVSHSARLVLQYAPSESERERERERETEQERKRERERERERERARER